jgi:hypothetical protein
MAQGQHTRCLASRLNNNKRGYTMEEEKKELTNEPEIAKQRTVIFCLPGESFSNRFLVNWSEILVWCITHGIRPVISSHTSCNIYYVRNMCLGANVLAGEDQKPFQGKVDYDDIIWIDSDNLPTPAHIERILSHDADIVAGYYRMENSDHIATVKSMNDDYFLKNGSYRFMHINEVSDHKDLFPVDYTGMGLMRVRKGVFEKLKYPWFAPIKMQIGGAVDISMEDAAFCIKARSAGFDVLIDPLVRVGHEKTAIY